MYGRYGYDDLSKFLLYTSMILMVASIFLRVFYPFALALMIWSLFRTYSKNINARVRELDKYRRMRAKADSFIKLRKRMWNERKTHKHFKCPSCKANLRVPKGKGEIIITCPKCGNKITKRT